MSKPIFYEGQAVGCLMFGEGVIACMSDETLRVDFAENQHSFLVNGAWMRDARPTLYPIDQYRSIIANLPSPKPEAWKPKPGEWCCFWDDIFSPNFIVSRFKEMHGHLYRAYPSSTWQYCAPFTGELPPHLKGGAQ